MIPSMKPFISKLLVCTLLCCALCAKADADAPTSEIPSKDYPSCFKAWDKKMHTLQTRFIQTTDYDGTIIGQSRGRISYDQKGPKLRLDNLEGDTVVQSALTDKKQIYILDEKGKEISKISWTDWVAGQPNKALFDFGNYEQLLTVHRVSVQEQNAEQAVLKLVPITPQENYILYVTVAADDCFPQQITVESDLIKTTAVLTDKKLNLPLPNDIFKELK